MPTDSHRPSHATTQRTDAPVTGRIGMLIGLVTALMSALAAGAVWSLLALSSGRTLAPLALGVGALLGWMLRQQRLGGRWWSGLLAAALTALAGLYAAYLMATADVATLLGLPMRSALPRIGPEMALAVAWARATAWDLVALGAGCALAAWLALWRARKAVTNA